MAANASSSAPPTVPATVTSSTTALESEGAVFAAYADFWRVLDEYGRELGPFDPVEFRARFSVVATGNEYEHLFSELQLQRSKGWVDKGGEDDQLRPRVAVFAKTRAEIEDCQDDSGGIFDTKTGVWVEELTPDRQSVFRVVLVVEDGLWKVASVGGGEPCAP